METYEFEGKTDQDAIENACRQLNLSKDQMDIVILEPGSAGIFGLVGGRKAKIKVTVKREEPETVEEAPEEDVQEATAFPEDGARPGERNRRPPPPMIGKMKSPLPRRLWKTSWP